MNPSLRGLKKRLDGFVSTVTGIGTTRDKKKSIQSVKTARRRKEWLSDFYADNSLARKACYLLPANALRKWLSIDHDRKAEIQKLLEDLQAKQFLKEACTKERKDGGAAIYVDIFDGRSLDQPVNINYSGFKVLGLRLIEMDDLEPLDKTGQTSSSPDARSAELFRMFESSGEYFNVHRDRLLVFPGREVSTDYRWENGGWGESELRGDVEEAITAYGVAHGTVPTIVQDFIIGILKLFGLNELIDADDDETLKARMDAAMTGESYINKLVIDSQDEYSREVANVSGLDGLITHTERRVSATTHTPHTIMLCESAGGSLGEGGKNQKSDWEETTEDFQQDKLLAPCKKLVKYAGAHLGIREDLPIRFNPLRVLTELEQSQLRKTNSETDGNYIRDGVLLEEEVRQSRFAGEYTTEITLDESAYKDYKAMAEEMAANLTQNAENDEPETDQDPDAQGQDDPPADA